MIDLGGESIGAGEYTHLGRVTEFKFCNHIAEAFRKYYSINNLRTLGQDWGECKKRKKDKCLLHKEQACLP